MTSRAADWFEQALRNLEQAEWSRRDARDEWACFAAQQAAEKAVKAVHLSLAQDACSHMVARPLNELPVDVPADLAEKAKVLDGFYIPTRYANSHAEGPPSEHFGVIHSDEALHYAREIIEFARLYVAAA